MYITYKGEIIPRHAQSTVCLVQVSQCVVHLANVFCMEQHSSDSVPNQIGQFIQMI